MKVPESPIGSYTMPAGSVIRRQFRDAIDSDQGPERFYERLGDHAVNIANRMRYAISGISVREPDPE